MDDACDGPDDAVARDDCRDGRERADAISTMRGPVWIPGGCAGAIHS